MVETMHNAGIMGLVNVASAWKCFGATVWNVGVRGAHPQPTHGAALMGLVMTVGWGEARTPTWLKQCTMPEQWDW